MSAPPWAWVLLAVDRDLAVRGRVARLANLRSMPAPALRSLLADPSPSVRRETAAHLPPDDARLLEATRSGDPDLARQVARRPHVPPQVLADLVDPDDVGLARDILANDNTDASVLSALGAVTRGRFQDALVTHPAAPADLLARAATGADGPHVQRALLEREDLPESVLLALVQHAPTLLYPIITRPDLPPAVVQAVADSSPKGRAWPWSTPLAA